MRVLLAWGHPWGEASVEAEKEEWRGFSWGLMVINIGCQVGGKSEVVHISYCKQ